MIKKTDSNIVLAFKLFLQAAKVYRDFRRLMKGYYGDAYKNVDAYLNSDPNPKHWLEDAFPWINDNGMEGHQKWSAINEAWKMKGEEEKLW